MSDSVESRIGALEGLMQAIDLALIEQVEKLGFAAGQVELVGASEAVYRLEKDPSNGEHSLVGNWLNAKTQKIGSLMFHSDGSFFVEQDVVQPHPNKKRCFVEAVSAWGKDSNIKAEARLLPMPE